MYILHMCLVYNIAILWFTIKIKSVFKPYIHAYMAMLDLIELHYLNKLISH